MSRIAPDATAVGERAAGFEVNVVAGWPPSSPDGERHRSWVRDSWDKLRPHSTGVYANFLSDEGTEGVLAAYGDRLRRLANAKRQFDPSNFFRMNANIVPTEEMAAS